jgi:hypothetical protein
MVHIGLDPLKHLVSATDHETVAGRFAEALLEISGHFFHRLLVPGTETDSHGGAEMIMVDRPAMRIGSLQDLFDNDAGLFGRVGGGQPVPYFAVRSIAASEEPPIQSGSGDCTGRGVMLAFSYW